MNETKSVLQYSQAPLRPSYLAMTDQYAVIGNPIAHSKSPVIHAAFAIQTGQEMSYERILGDLEDFAGDVRDFFAAGGKGLNVTVPFKEQAWELADKLSPRAATAAAANTLIPLDDGGISGDNTDGVGLVTDLGCNHRFNFSGAKVLLLGAGGASRGVLRPLLEQGLGQLVIANRTADKAVRLAEEVADLGAVRGCGLGELAGTRYDLIINGTAAGLSQQVPDIPLDCLLPGGWVYDMMYDTTKPTAFVRWGEQQGAARTLDGLGMLVEQAAESFYLWRGIRPDTESIIQQLRTY